MALTFTFDVLRAAHIVYRSTYDADGYTYNDLIGLRTVIDDELDLMSTESGTGNDLEVYVVVRKKLASYIRWHGESDHCQI